VEGVPLNLSGATLVALDEHTNDLTSDLGGARVVLRDAWEDLLRRDRVREDLLNRAADRVTAREPRGRE
jgi:hypothetical protein